MRQSLARRAASVVAVTSTIVGVTFMIVKLTPAGADVTKNIICWSNSGSTVACIRETGQLNLSGSLISKDTLSGATIFGSKLSPATDGDILCKKDDGEIGYCSGSITGVNCSSCN